jgi:lipopolysaccharide transport system permease protein
VECADGAGLDRSESRGCPVKPSTVKGGIHMLIQYRRLLRTLIARDLRVKYRDTFIGFWWMLIQPLLMLSTYALVFGGIFGSRWQNKGTAWDFVLLLFCGLILFVMFSDTVNRTTTVIRSQPNFIKKVVFPLEILPIVILGSAIFSALINFTILFVLTLAINFSIQPTAIFLPLVIIPLLILLAGLAWGIASLSVFFPDLGQIITFLSSLLLFLSPVFFPLSAAPKLVQPFLMLNPISFPIEEARNVILLGYYPDWMGLAIYSIIACVIAFFGLWVFQRSRTAFADVV